MKTLITSILLLLTIEGYSQCLHCEKQVNYSMDENCEIVIMAEDLINEDSCPGDYLLSIRDQYGMKLSNPIQGYHGMVLSVTVLDWNTGSTCFTTVTLEDKLPPVINAIVTPVGATCADDLSSLVLIDASDNCGSVNTTLITSAFIKDGNCGPATAYLIYEISDNAGNTTTVNTQFDVIDFCPDISAAAIVYADCSDNIATVGMPVFGPNEKRSDYDVRTVDISIAPNQISRQWIVEEIYCGNIIKFNQTIYILPDNEVPTIFTVHNGSFSYEEYETGAIIKAINAIDNCGISDVNVKTVDKNTVQCSPLIFEITYEAQAIDLSGNVSTKKFTFTVKQDEPPYIDIIPESSLCLGSGYKVIAYTEGMEAPLTYRWSSSWPMKKNVYNSNALVYPNSSRATISVTVTDGFGCEVERKETFYRCRFREKIEGEVTEIALNPNLVIDQAQLKLPFVENDAWNISIVDMMGKVVMNRINITSNAIDLNLASLPAGSYFIQVANQEEKHTEKFVKL